MPLGHDSLLCWMYSSFLISCVSPGTHDCLVENRLFVVDSVKTPTVKECKQTCEEDKGNCTVSYELPYHFKISISK